MRTAQVPWELETLRWHVGSPRRVLEIGVWFGGTLAHWLSPGAFVVAIDDQMLRASEWAAWAKEADAELHLLHGRSQAEGVVAHVAALGPYDFVFIDGSHAYADVLADWSNYHRMVAPGGIVAFHDILPRPDSDVSTLWQEIKEGRRTVEIVGTEPSPDMDDPRAGIGVIYL